MLSPLMDSQKLAGDLRVSQRTLIAPFITASIVAFIVGSAAFLYVNYTFGGLNVYHYPDNNASNLYGRASNAILGLGTPFDGTAKGGLAVGLTVALALVRLRAFVPTFPFHPLAYAIAPTWAMMVLWFPCFVAWMIKVPVMRYGGITLYRKLRPFMLGMILGEFAMGMLWALLSMTRGMPAPDFPWP